MVCRKLDLVQVHLLVVSPAGFDSVNLSIQCKADATDFFLDQPCNALPALPFDYHQVLAVEQNISLCCPFCQTHQSGSRRSNLYGTHKALSILVVLAFFLLSTDSSPYILRLINCQCSAKQRQIVLADAFWLSCQLRLLFMSMIRNIISSWAFELLLELCVTCLGCAVAELQRSALEIALHIGWY